LKTIDELNIGELAIIIGFNGNAELQSRLVEMGINPGVLIRLVRKSLFGGPLQLKIREYYVSIRKCDAKDIRVSLHES
jgi:ferrous iron transport protein A